MRDLSPEQRLHLMRFVCSFAWADLHVADEERSVITKMIRRLEFTPAERAQIDAWLEVPPTPEDVDPQNVPRDHRERFLAAARAIIEADGGVVAAERDSYRLLEQMLA